MGAVEVAMGTATTGVGAMDLAATDLAATDLVVTEVAVMDLTGFHKEEVELDVAEVEMGLQRPRRGGRKNVIGPIGLRRIWRRRRRKSLEDRLPWSG